MASKKRATRRKTPVKAPKSMAGNKPGVIDSIVTALQRAPKEGVTVEQLLKGLAKKFPNRPLEALETTTRCQLARLPATKKVKVIKRREGRTVFYRSPAPAPAG